MITHPRLSERVDAGIRLGLARVGEFLTELGSPQLAVPVIHIAGTNGKGSTSAMCAAALRASGLRVGVTMSPHLQHLNERIVVDGQPISDAVFDALLEELHQRAVLWAGDDLPPGKPPLTYFELLIVAAFVHFSRSQLDVAVIEVGLGGRLDATNLVKPLVTAITTIGLDHCDRLGPDHASVASEKAGILKEGVPMVVGELPRDALSVVRSMAAERRAPLLVQGEQYSATGHPGDFAVQVGERSYEGLKVGLAGQHQVHNAAVAVAVLAQLQDLAPALAPTEAAIREGLAAAHNPGRCEWLSPTLLVDGAHNAEAAEALARYLESLPRDTPRTLLLGASQDKDIRSVAATLAPQVDRVLTSACRHPRALPPGALAEALVGLDLPVLPAGPVEQALPLAQQGDGLLIVAGSLFITGAVRELVLGS